MNNIEQIKKEWCDECVKAGFIPHILVQTYTTQDDKITLCISNGDGVLSAIRLYKTPDVLNIRQKACLKEFDLFTNFTRNLMKGEFDDK